MGFRYTPSGGLPPSTSKLDTTAASSEVDASSRNIQFELMKNEIQKMAQIETAMSNVIATMNEQANTAIRNTKA